VLIFSECIERKIYFKSEIEKNKKKMRCMLTKYFQKHLQPPILEQNVKHSAKITAGFFAKINEFELESALAYLNKNYLCPALSHMLRAIALKNSS
jgi:hypothetical protein